MRDNADSPNDENRARPVIDYQPPPTSPPVTRRERVAVLVGYVLLAGGILLTLRALRSSMAGAEHSILPLGVILMLTGAGITGSCYIYNAIRRM